VVKVAMMIACGAMVAGCHGSQTTVECGAGTMLQGDACVPTGGPTCGAGTHADNGMCLPDAPGLSAFELRTSSMIRADGWSGTEVRVVGLQPDGTPSHDEVVLASNPASAGQFVSPSFVLDDIGGASSFIPCNSVTPGCVGAAEFTVALASAPQTPVAHVDVQLVAPPAIASATPCLAGGNILHFDGQNFDYNGSVTFSTDGAFNASGGPDRGFVQMVANASNTSWNLTFTTRQVGIPLIASVYEQAQDPLDIAAPGDPGFTISGNGYPVLTNCASFNAFQIEDYQYDAAQQTVTALTASFTQVCLFQPGSTLSGCVHFAQ
jgi:hypothetical protein